VSALRAEFVTSAASPSQFPKPSGPEVALLGRSNVGKSSLLNRLVARRNLARTSSTPGKTRLVNWFRVEGERSLCLVDLPGYGYARVPKRERESWKPLIEAYLARGAALRAALLLQDVRRDLCDDERLLLAWLAERAVPALLVLTKCDKLGPMRRAERVRALAAASGLPREQVLATSAETGLGIPDLWRAIDERLRDPGVATLDARCPA
jgi:GTP-binding protein